MGVGVADIAGGIALDLERSVLIVAGPSPEIEGVDRLFVGDGFYISSRYAVTGDVTRQEEADGSQRFLPGDA